MDLSSACASRLDDSWKSGWGELHMGACRRLRLNTPRRGHEYAIPRSPRTQRENGDDGSGESLVVTKQDVSGCL